MLKQYLVPAVFLGALGVYAEKSAADVITAIVPKVSADCTKPKYNKEECRTASQAAQYLVDSFMKYEIYNYFEIGAVLALIGLESDNLEANINHSPGRPGQGTRNMMQANFIAEYATELGFGDKVKEINLLESEVDYLLNINNTDANKKKAQLLELVKDDKYSWGSGAWFLARKCNQTRAELAKGTDKGWIDYNLCVVKGDTVDPERTKYWTRAKDAWK